MILAAFGDSFIYGSDLSDCPENYHQRHTVHSNKTFASLAAKKLNMEYICTALPGQGNTIIYDDVCRIISSYGSSAFYYINWTYSDRFDYISTDDNCWRTITPSCTKPNEEFYYKNLHAELTDKLQTLTYIANIIQLLKNNNCKFLMTCMDTIIFDTKWHCPPSIQLLQQTVLPYIKNFEGDDFLTWAKKHNYPISEKNHPLEQAHENAAVLLKHQIEKICV